MIEELSEYQREQLEVYRDKYIQKGLNIKPINIKFAQKIMNLVYTKILKRKKVKVIICDNPLDAYYMCYYYKILKRIFKKFLLQKRLNTKISKEICNEVQNEVLNKVRNEVWNEVWNEVKNEVKNEVRNEVENEVGNEVKNEIRNEVRNEVWNEVKNEVRNEVENEVRNEVRKEVWDKVGNEVWNEVKNEIGNEVRNEAQNEVRNEIWNEVRNEIWNEVENEVRNEVRNKVWNEVRNEIWNEVENEVWNEVENEAQNEVGDEVWKEVWNEIRQEIKIYTFPYLYGSFDSSYFSFYSYCRDILNIKYKASYAYKIYEKTINFNIIYCLKDICIMSENPIEINRNSDGRLHANGKPALRYKNLNLWRLNGIKVPEYIVKTPKEKLDPRDILKEKNVEVRREGIRKIGIQNCLKELHPVVLDTRDTYELLRINFTDNNRLYLKMKNPSTGTWHIEAVHPSCTYIKKALAWRDGEMKYEKPEVLT
jgi:hypothetical protein